MLGSGKFWISAPEVCLNSRVAKHAEMHSNTQVRYWIWLIAFSKLQPHLKIAVQISNLIYNSSLQKALKTFHEFNREACTMSSNWITAKLQKRKECLYLWESNSLVFHLLFISVLDGRSNHHLKPTSPPSPKHPDVIQVSYLLSHLAWFPESCLLSCSRGSPGTS